MIITLSNGVEAEIKLIDLAKGQVDYSTTNHPTYNGDRVLYLAIVDLQTAEADIAAALEIELAVEEP